MDECLQSWFERLQSWLVCVVRSHGLSVYACIVMV